MCGVGGAWSYGTVVYSMITVRTHLAKAIWNIYSYCIGRCVSDSYIATTRGNIFTEVRSAEVGIPPTSSYIGGMDQPIILNILYTMVSAQQTNLLPTIYIGAI